MYWIETDWALNQAASLGRVPEDGVAEDIGKLNINKRFGKFGGQFIPETLSEAFREIEEEYVKIKDDKDFLAELEVYRRDFVGGPTPLHKAERLTEMCGGATIWLRERIWHTLELTRLTMPSGRHCWPKRLESLVLLLRLELDSMVLLPPQCVPSLV